METDHDLRGPFFIYLKVQDEIRPTAASQTNPQREQGPSAPEVIF